MSNATERRESADLMAASLRELIEWAEQMGGWEAPAWRRAKAALVAYEQDRKPAEGREAALRALVDTINATGGLIEHEDGSRAPAGDPEWIHLADAYAMACEALGVAEVIQSFDGREDIDEEERRIRAYEAQGMTRSDAQACVMADDAKASREEATR